MLREVYERYHRPMFIAETGAEDRLRAGLAALCLPGGRRRHSPAEFPLHGICLYPILNHPGWVDDRHCHNALVGLPGRAAATRKIYRPAGCRTAPVAKVFETQDAVARMRQRVSDESRLQR